MSLNKCVTETDQIRVHNIFFMKKKRKIIPKSSELPHLICTTSDYMTDAAQSEVSRCCALPLFRKLQENILAQGSIFWLTKSASAIL